MRLRIWGCRGSLPTPLDNRQLREKLRLLLAEATPADLATPASREAFLDRSPHGSTYGGDTSCVELSFGDTIIILDAGSGISRLGADLGRTGRGTGKRIHHCFTHFHWDHICGLPFFPLLYRPGQTLEVWSGRKDAEDLLRVQMSSAHFPGKWERDVKATINFHVLTEGEPVDIDGATVRIMRLNHPDLAFGYRIDVHGRTICYLTDTEISKNPAVVAGAYGAFVAGAEVVMVDAMYGFLQYHDWINFGHSTIFNWIDLFGSSDIRELVIFHHDRLADDQAVLQLLGSAQKYQELVTHGSGWTISAAREGMTWEWPD
jgi:phosphoribosyl 1,2-cyclic phosphodiesterase